MRMRTCTTHLATCSAAHYSAAMTAEDQAPDFADWLRGIAERRGYSLSDPGRRAGGRTQLAADAGLPQSVVSRVLNGSSPSPETALKLARPLLVSPAEALDRAGHREIAAHLRDLSAAADVTPASRVLRNIESADLDEATKRSIAAAYQREVAQVVAHIDEMIAAALAAKRTALANGTSSGSSAEDRMTDAVRRLLAKAGPDLSPDEFSALEAEALRQLAEVEEYVRLKAEMMRRRGEQREGETQAG